MNFTVGERFLRYVQIDTESDPNSDTYPSTEKQKDLTNLLCKELTQLGIHAEVDEYNYLIAHIPSNVDQNVPSIFFCAHVDTTPDCSGKDVIPIVRHNYQGEVLTFPNEEGLTLDPKAHPKLLNKIGHDLITASGNTLLGSDDKSGVAIIMDLAHQLTQDPSILHGDVYLLFTPDEEIGKGVLHLDVDKLPADFGYTLDGGDVGEFNIENFSADALTVKIQGVTAHPGYAKGKMESAIKIASEIVTRLPKDSLCPEVAGQDDGFIHPTNIEGDLGNAEINFILRNFDTKVLSEYHKIIEDITKDVLLSYPNSQYEIIRKEQYRNMYDIIREKPYIQDLALEAIKKAGITPSLRKIRGGTDGAVLTYKGRPCPNIFAGEQAIHSKLEWTSIQDMQLAVETLIHICTLNTTMSHE